VGDKPAAGQPSSGELRSINDRSNGTPAHAGVFAFWLGAESILSKRWGLPYRSAAARAGLRPRIRRARRCTGTGCGEHDAGRTRLAGHRSTSFYRISPEVSQRAPAMATMRNQRTKYTALRRVTVRVLSASHNMNGSNIGRFACLSAAETPRP